MELSNLLHQEVTLEFYQERGSYGDIVYQSPKVYPCRVSGEEKIIRDNQGREAVSKLRVTILGNVPNRVTVGTQDYPGLDARSRVTLPEGCLPQQPPIVQVGRYPDMNGQINHTSIYF